MILKNIELLKFKNKTINKMELTRILRNFWEKEFDEHELNSNIIIQLREYVIYIKTRLLIQRKKIIDNMLMIKRHKKDYENIRTKFLAYDSKNEADLKIILDIYEDHIVNNRKFTFISFDKKLTDTLELCDFNFLEHIVTKTI